MNETADDLSELIAPPVAGSPQAVIESSDDALVAATLRGEEAAFEILFERHRRFVAHVAGRFFHRREQIEEIIQESFTKAFFALKDYRGSDPSKSFPAWLRRIAVNTAYDELRRMQRHPESFINDFAEEETAWLDAQVQPQSAKQDVESQLIARDLAHKLLDRLRPEDRLVLTLLDAEECSTAEIAELTGWSIAKVKVRAHRARARLRGMLQKLL